MFGRSEVVAVCRSISKTFMTHWRADIAWKIILCPDELIVSWYFEIPSILPGLQRLSPKARRNQTVIYSFVYLQTKENFYFYFTAVKGCFSTNSTKSGKSCWKFISPALLSRRKFALHIQPEFCFRQQESFRCSRERHRGSRAHKQAKQTDYNVVVIASGGNEMGNNVLWLQNSSNYAILMRFLRRLEWKSAEYSEQMKNSEQVVKQKFCGTSQTDFEKTCFRIFLKKLQSLFRSSWWYPRKLHRSHFLLIMKYLYTLRVN